MVTCKLGALIKTIDLKIEKSRNPTELISFIIMREMRYSYDTTDSEYRLNKAVLEAQCRCVVIDGHLNGFKANGITLFGGDRSLVDQEDGRWNPQLTSQ